MKKRVTIFVDEEVAKKLKILAIQHNMTLSQYCVYVNREKMFKDQEMKNIFERCWNCKEYGDHGKFGHPK